MIKVIDITFLELFAVHVFPLVIGLLLVKLAKVPLGKFVVIYALLAAISILIKQYMYGNEFLAVSLISSIGALIVLVILSGFMGTKLSSANYETILLSLGLFSWTLSLSYSICFVVLFGFFIMIHSLVRQKRAFKNLREPYMSLKEAKRKLSPEKYKIFQKEAGVIYAVPMIIAAVVSSLMFSNGIF